MKRAGIDYDRLSLNDWVDIAWAGVLDGCPAMADAGKYHTMMYEAFWNGNFPSEGTNKEGETISRQAAPSAAKDELADLFAQAKALRGEGDE